MAVGDLTGSGLNDIVVSNVGREDLVVLERKFSPTRQLEKLAGPEERRSYLFHQKEGRLHGRRQWKPFRLLFAHRRVPPTWIGAGRNR